MRKVVLFLIIGVLGGLYVVQTQHEQNAQEARARASQVARSREPGEHDWMKQSLDTTKKVTSQNSQQRKEDSVRD
jgi:Tfp pilus assembly protein PilV